MEAEVPSAQLHASPAVSATFQGRESDINILGDQSGIVRQENNNPNSGYVRPAISACTSQSVMLRLQPRTYA